MTDSHSPTPGSGPEKIKSSTARDEPRSREANSASLVNSKNHEPASVPLARYWYRTTTVYCPQCGKTENIRERQYDERPKDYDARNTTVEQYDYCDS